MKIAVIGSSCRIGQKLEAALKVQAGLEVLCESDFKENWRFGESINLEGIDRLVILAHDRRLDELTHLIFIRDLLESYSGKIIYLSTMSANRKSVSRYGRTKYFIEQEVLERGGLVLRSGIVWDTQTFGILKKLISISKFPLILYPKVDLVQFRMTNIDDLVQCLVKHSIDFEAGLIYSLNNHIYTLKLLLTELATRKILFIKVSHKLINFAIKSLRVMRMREIADSISILLEQNSLVPKSHSCSFRFFDKNEIEL